MCKEQRKHPFLFLLLCLLPPNPLFLVGERGDIYSQFMITPPPVVRAPHGGGRFFIPYCISFLLRLIENFAPHRMGLGAFCLIMYRVPITSHDAEATHWGYWEKKITLPIEHPLGNKHHPDGTASALLNLQMILHRQMKCYKGLEKIIDLQTLSLRNYNPTRYLKIHYLILQI